MATRAAEARPAQPVRHERRDTARRERPGLDLVDKRDLQARRERRQVRLLAVLSGAVIAGSLAAVAGGRALVASEQVRADSLGSQIATALTTQQALRLERANLETPQRILSIATRTLGMVTPTSVVYLPPVNPGATVAEAHAGSAAPTGKGAAAGSHASTSKKGSAGQSATPGSSSGSKG